MMCLEQPVFSTCGFCVDQSLVLIMQMSFLESWFYTANLNKCQSQDALTFLHLNVQLMSQRLLYNSVNVNINVDFRSLIVTSVVFNNKLGVQLFFFWTIRRT